MNKRLLFVAAVVGLVCAAGFVQAHYQGTEVVAEQVDAELQPLSGFDSIDSAGAWLPLCRNVHGRSCPRPGAITRCLLAPGEPEICICQGTWNCRF